MSRVRFNSFEELSVEISKQLDGSTSVSIKEERRLDIETTDAIFGNIMPASFPNPEQVLEQLEEALSRRWDNNPSRERRVYVERKPNELRFAYVKRVLEAEKQAFIARELVKAYL